MIFSQRDKRWADIKTGNTNLTIGNFGCYLTCLAMLSNTTPDIVNALFTRKKAYDKDGLIKNEIAYPLVGLKFLGKSERDPRTLCIATTNFYMPTVPRHFFVLKPDGTIVDPWTGLAMGNKYKGHIVSYRLFEYIHKEGKA